MFLMLFIPLITAFSSLFVGVMLTLVCLAWRNHRKTNPWSLEDYWAKRCKKPLTTEEQIQYENYCFGLQLEQYEKEQAKSARLD
jgi:hypothetical protein